MVYSRLQRIPSSSAQKAVRILAGTGVPGDDRERDVARALVNEFEAPGSMGVFLRRLRFARLSEFADGILQPVEQSYTVASLDALARRCGLEMLQPVVSVYNKLRSNFTWDLTLPTPVLEQAYLRCDDVQRWQVANLLLGEDSPLLWFYFRRAGAAPPPTTREICDAFLATPFSKVATRRQAYALGADDHYRLVPGSITFPPAIDGPLRAVVDAADGRTPMRDILGRCGIPTTFPHVNDVRSRLTTTAFPYLKAVAS